MNFKTFIKRNQKINNIGELMVKGTVCNGLTIEAKRILFIHLLVTVSYHSCVWRNIKRTRESFIFIICKNISIIYVSKWKEEKYLN